jgi:MFS family permease
VAAFLLIAIYCPPLRHARKPKVDYLGAAFISLALATLVLAVDNTETTFASLLDSTGLSLATLRIIMFGIVALATAAFIYVERKSSEPILPLRFFRNRNFSLIIGVASLFGVGFMGSILYLTQFNQQVFGASPTESGLMLLPMVGGMMTASIGSGQIISRIGRYKIFMQIGIVMATVMVTLLATLRPESSYVYEAFIMMFLGLGLGFVMPVMNIAVQNEFKLLELGVATSSIQLFRGLGSTIGIALFGALLTSGLTSQLSDMRGDPYLASLSTSPAVQRIGDVYDPNTMLTLNAPDIKHKISDGFTKSVAGLPESARSQATMTFESNQQAYSSKITHAFSKSLVKIFATSGVMMALAVVLVMFIKERELKAAKPDETPGEVA